MRTALMAIFEEPEREQPSFLIGKLRDVLALHGARLGPASRAWRCPASRPRCSTPILECARPGRGRGAASSGCWPCAWAWRPARCSSSPSSACSRSPNTPSRSLWSGALLGRRRVRGPQAALRPSCSRPTANSEAFQAFGIALILMVWINYSSRVVVLSAAWAHTSPEARAVRDANRVADQMPEGPRIDLAAAAPGVRSASCLASLPRPRRPPSPPAPPRCSGSSPSSAAGAD